MLGQCFGNHARFDSLPVTYGTYGNNQSYRMPIGWLTSRDATSS
ncbi:TPA: hypothetical protein QFS68_001991 [Enterococcus faecium]